MKFNRNLIIKNFLIYNEFNCMSKYCSDSNAALLTKWFFFKTFICRT